MLKIAFVLAFVGYSPFLLLGYAPEMVALWMLVGVVIAIISHSLLVGIATFFSITTFFVWRRCYKT